MWLLINCASYRVAFLEPLKLLKDIRNVIDRAIADGVASGEADRDHLLTNFDLDSAQLACRHWSDGLDYRWLVGH
jgi:hypothetical protein